jgi:hypothetical protein
MRSQGIEKGTMKVKIWTGSFVVLEEYEKKYPELSCSLYTDGMVSFEGEEEHVYDLLVGEGYAIGDFEVCVGEDCEPS